AVRKLFAERRGVGRFRQIRVEHNNIGLVASQLHQRFAEGFARGHSHFQFVRDGCGHYWSSCSAFAASSGVGAASSTFGLFSMNETPLPLMVCAMMQVGLPLTEEAAAKAF